MKHLLATLAFAVLAAACHAQTIRTLGYSTNGQIVAATNVVWTNAFNFSSNAVVEAVRNNLQAASSTGLAPDTAGAANRAISIINNDTGSEVLTYDELSGEKWVIADSQGFQSALFSTNTAPTNTTNVSAWTTIQIGTNTFRVPLYK